MKLTQYPKEILKTWRTSRLGCLYMNCYMISRDDPEEFPQLEMVAQILSTRLLSEREDLLRAIKSTVNPEIEEAQKQGDIQKKALLLGMQDYYLQKVLPDNQYDQNELETLGTNQLGSLFQVCFMQSRTDSDRSSQLESVVQVLSARPYLERKRVYQEIKTELRQAQRLEENEKFGSLIQMINHYVEKVIRAGGFTN